MSLCAIVGGAAGPLAVTFFTADLESTLRIVECFEPAGILAISHPAVEALDMAALHGSAGLDELDTNQSDFAVAGPGGHAP